jgi:23S rRNA pseudouridine2605 synthase
MDTAFFVEDVSYIEGEAKSEIGLKLRSANVKVVRSILNTLAMMY